MHYIYSMDLPYKEIPGGKDSQTQDYDIKPLPESWITNSKCSEEDKRDLLPMVIELIYFHQKAKKIGILGLYDNLDKIRNSFFYLALNYVLEGFPASLIDTVLTNRINYDGVKGKELKERMIIKDGVLSIAVGNTPSAAKVLLFSILNLPGIQDIIDQALDRWGEEKTEYFVDDEIREVRRILEFKKL